MFKGYCISLTLVWLAILLASVWIFSHPSPLAQEIYQRLVDINDSSKNEPITEKPHLTQQTRYHVSKQVLYKQGHHRLQSRLASENSELIFDQKAHGAELVEYFKDMECSLQEKLFYAESEEEKNVLAHEDIQKPKQFFRHLKADEGVYFYKTGRLEAQHVELARYLLPEHQWPDPSEFSSPLLQGRAQSIEFSLSQEPTFKAQRLQATFRDWGSGW